MKGVCLSVCIAESVYIHCTMISMAINSCESMYICYTMISMALDSYESLYIQDTRSLWPLYKSVVFCCLVTRELKTVKTTKFIFTTTTNHNPSNQPLPPSSILRYLREEVRVDWVGWLVVRFVD